MTARRHSHLGGVKSGEDQSELNEASNAYLPEFLAAYDERFAREPPIPHDAQRPLRDARSRRQTLSSLLSTLPDYLLAGTGSGSSMMEVRMISDTPKP